MSFNINDNDESNEMLLVHEIARQLRFCFDRRVKHLGLTRSQWRILCIIRRNPDIRQNQIAAMLELEPMTIMRTLNRMEKNGWIKRRINPEDKRANIVNIASKANKILEKMRKISLETRKDALKDFTLQDHQKLLGYLNRIKSNINQMI